jgi:hypothetical protein
VFYQVSGYFLLPLLLEKAAFDFGGDLDVDLDQPVGEVVAEAFSLGDFGDAVGDEPGLVAVPQPMKGQFGSNGVGALRWSPSMEHATVEGTAPQRMAAWAGEHK